MDRNFTAKLTVKVLDEDQRLIEGVASSSRRDRQDDVLEPLGAEYDLPIPFLLDHDHRQNVGEVEMAEATNTGIRFRARIKKIAEPGLAKDLVDQAWHYLKYGLRPMVSVGFQPIDYEPLPDGGYRYKRWSWYELSAVSVGAQPDAVVTGVKRAPRESRPAKHSDRKPLPVLKLTPQDILKGKWAAEADRRIAARKRLGIPLPVVKLDPVDLVMARAKAKRAADKGRKPLAGKLSIRR